MALLVTAMELLDSSSDDDSVSGAVCSDCDDEYDDACILSRARWCATMPTVYPGSVHDARVLRESPFFARAIQECEDNYILGDSAYPLMPWLMTPFKDNGSSFPTWKKSFNKRHSQQRVLIENTFGLLKQRFRRLYLVDAKSVQQCCYIVMAACVLHNMCNDERDFLEELATLPQEEDVGNDESEGDFDCSLPGYSQSLREFIAKEQC
ncbi:hypothetical protein HPB51_026915 [Rhipicephalus microplus]|uniref:DDE Tnp4 domain-containing protein n=1 Tax=Rhipicephalus microplus TaxID=6941 RepID=A0A9J6D1S6_RHIMP|nr:hypothetical protein HPB51_026915 [Rhipicephalus microplus]